LEAAIRTLGASHPVTVHWHAYELNPAMPPDGIDRRTYRTRKFGSWERSQELDAQVAAVGAQEGLHFAFDRITRTPNTLDAHRLIWLAGQAGVQDTVVEALFRAYFTDGRDLSDRAVLMAVVCEAGLDCERVERLLAGEDAVGEVHAAQDRARRLGV